MTNIGRLIRFREPSGHAFSFIVSEWQKWANYCPIAWKPALFFHQV
ncbi:hypothetical protein RTCIAT899_PB02305 (plasmid) [Rhizobium tropici CIAT 899]|nr:hypothetical protein RTCIAT899_PB02305 [Rhizobium tropici CIAT 899]